MKKTLSVLLICVFIFTLAGCSKSVLKNDFFENTKQDSFDNAKTLLNTYLSRAQADLQEYYPRSYEDSVMWFEDSYINTQLLQKDIVYRHEFYNYHLTDERYYMRVSDLYNLSEFYLHLNADEACGEIKEGEQCSNSYVTQEGNLVKYGLKFYMEGDTLLMNHVFTTNQSILFNYTFYFYKNEAYDDVMEMTILQSDVEETTYERMAYTKLIFGKSEESFICNNCDIEDPSVGSLEYIYNDFHKYDNNEKPQFESSNIDSFTHLYLTEDSTHGNIFDGESGELFGVEKTNDVYEIYNYSKYIRNTSVVRYSDTFYSVNLSEILGWDNLRKIPDESNLYSLYYGDELLSSNQEISLELQEGEYPSFEYSLWLHPDEEGIPEEVIDLSIINLSSPFSTDFFAERFTYGTSLFEAELTSRNLNNQYSDNYSMFIDIIMSLQESN